MSIQCMFITSDLNSLRYDLLQWENPNFRTYWQDFPAVFILFNKNYLLQNKKKTRCVGTTRMSPSWILRRLANVSPFFNSLSNRLRITNEFQIWSVTYDYTLSYQKSSQYLNHSEIKWWQLNIWPNFKVQGP